MTAIIPKWGNTGIVCSDRGCLLQYILEYDVEFIRMTDLVACKVGEFVTYHVGQHIPVVVSSITVLQTNVNLFLVDGV